MDETLNQNGLENLPGGNDAPEVKEASVQGGAGESGSTQAAAWTSQLPREIRGNEEVFSKLAAFKTVGELADAYLAKGEAAEADITDVKGLLEKLGAPKEGEFYEFEKDLKDELSKFGETARGAMLTRDQAAAMLEGYKGIIEARTADFLAKAKAEAPALAKALTEEFGAAWYRKAVEGNGLNSLLARSGLGADKQLARALVLLGREMSEDCTPGGRSRGAEKPPQRLNEGAQIAFNGA